MKIIKTKKTKNKKIKLNVKRFLSFITITMLLTIIISLLISNAAIGKQESIYQTIVIKNGDSIWSIAQKNNNYDSMEEYVDKIYKLNKLSDSNVYPGQKILIPKY